MTGVSILLKKSYLIFVFSFLNSLLIRQRANVKIMVTRKQMKQHFPKTNISYRLISIGQKINISFR